MGSIPIARRQPSPGLSLAEIGTDIGRAAALLAAGQVVGLPTETVYGLGGDALNPDAILRIYEVKRRPRFNPLIAHVPDVEAAQALVTDWPEAAEALARRFWPGPLTLLLPRADRVPDLCTAGQPRVALRVPDHPLTLALLRRLGRPLAAPSANPSNYISPTTAAHVVDQLGPLIPYVLDGGPARVGVESTILGLDDDGPRLYRAGGLALEDIEAVVGTVLPPRPAAEGPEAPGALRQHYAPRARLRLHGGAGLPPGLDPARTAALRLRQPLVGLPPERQRVLSPSGDLREAARGLFAALRELDALGAELILAEPPPPAGHGLAILDRLTRGAAGPA